jgi:signal transduction histidine kinase
MHILDLSREELLAGKFRQRRYIRSDGTPMPPSEFASTRAREEQKTVYNVETGVVKENGEMLWTSVNAAPVDIADVEVIVATIDITERKKAEEALHKHRERLRILSRRLVEVQEEERRAIARELHDRVGQNLAALNLNLNILRSQLTSTALLEVGQRLSDSVNLVNQILTITRNVMGDLRSDVLDDYGLEAAMREYAEKFTARTGVQVLFDKLSKPIPRTEPSIEMTLLRIAQEALTNVAKHAQAKQATVSVSADNEAVYMSIQDDGIGILSWQRANQPGSHGLRIIRERAEAFGGSLQVQSTYKKGTRIDVKIPLVNLGPSRLPREKRS